MQATLATAHQQQVIDEEGHLLVVAGPGSGKTWTLVQKIKRILSTPRTRVVAVTFTRDGADELAKRLSAVLDPQVAGRVEVGTFHSLTLRHLDRLGRKPRIVTPAQQSSFLNRCLDMLPPPDRAAARMQFEAAKCSFTPDEQVTTQPWYEAYEQMLRRNDAIDLYDLMRSAVVDMGQAILPPMPGTHLVVDEAQDSDAIQFQWVRVHAAAGVITTMVGDDDQTIYEWRRAIGYPGMRRFAEEYSAAVVPLGSNFRSLGNIVAASDAVISNNNPMRLRKELIARRGDGGKIRTLVSGSLRQAAEDVAKLILDQATLVDDGVSSDAYEVPTGSWAVLARSNFGVNQAQAALDAVGVRNYRNSASIYESHPAQVFLNLISCLETGDSMGLEMGLNHSGLPHDVVGNVLESFKGRLLELMEAPPDFARFGPHAQALEQFFRRTSVWKRFARAGELVDLFDRVGDFVVSRLREKDYDFGEALCSALAGRLMRSRPRGLAAKVQAIQLQGKKKTTERAVALHTMHSAKGLEFDNVVIVGLDDETIPGDIERLGSGAGEVANIAAERRLFYVAITRAKNNLWLSYTGGKASRFLREIPAALISQ